MWKLLLLVALASSFPVSWCPAQAPAAPTPTAQAPAVRLLWRAATGGQIRSAPVVGPDGTVYAVSEDGFLYAWDSDGTPRWKRNLSWIPADCLSVGNDGTIYTALRNRDFVAVNPRGLLLWRVPLDAPPVGDPALGSDGTIFVATAAGTLAAISQLGRLEWTVTLPGSITQPPILDGDGTLFVPAADRRLYAFTSWGQFKWSLPLPGLTCPPAIGDGGSVVLGSDAGDVIAVSSGGDVLWRYPIGSAVVGVSVDSRQIVATASDGAVVGLSNDGKELWRVNAARTLDAAAYLVGPQVLVVAVDGTLITASPSRGIVGSVAAGTTGRASLDPGGRLFLGGRDWVVYSFGLASPLDPADQRASDTEPWPQPGHDQRHSGQSQARPPVGNQSLLAQLPDYLYLQSLVASGSHDTDLLLLSEIRSRVGQGTLGKSTWYVENLLERLAGEGLLSLVYQYNRLINNFVDVRQEAAHLLGIVGSLRSRDVLIQLLRSESDPLVLSAQIGALGTLASDSDGASARAIADAVSRQGRYPPDERLARAAVDALAAIAYYRGGWSDPSAPETLLAIFHGSFSQEVRSAAAAALQDRAQQDHALQDQARPNASEPNAAP